ncbi:BrnA antitoxin family protein [Methylobacterium oxalidis]|uniref:BrnA antitoxin family protein n=1 Tax=Methylobacterium oxalidis TaxID=944322 RepID=UPI003315AC65
MPDGKTAKPARGRTDWAALRALSEDAIERIAAEDADNPATVDEAEWARGTVGLPPRKTAIHATFDQDVVAFFKQGGRGYQTRMNAVLRRYMEAQIAKKEG